jgi:LemA protein
VDTFLQQRSDLIPNLVETVKGYAVHESQVLTEVARWRSQGMAAASLPDRQAAMLGMERSLGQVLALAEQYPELKADRNFARLQDELSGIEEQLNRARRYYNGAVRNLNVAVQSFPGNLLAGLAGVQPAPFFEAQAQARQAPRVDFSSQDPQP